MTRVSKSGRARKVSLFGRALAGVGSMLDIQREAQEMRVEAQRRYPSAES